MSAAVFLQVCAMDSQSRRSVYEDCMHIKCSAWKLIYIYKVLYVNSTGTKKKWLPSKQACVFVRMQSKPMSYTEIRDEHGSWTLKLVWQRAIRKEMPHLLFLKKKYICILPSLLH